MKKLLFIFFPFLLFSQQQPKVGLVLSGGGAKGFAHIGVLKELERSGVEISHIGGTSMGAIIGGLYAAGYTANQIEQIVDNTDFMELLQDKIARRDTPFFRKQHGEKHAISLPIKNSKIGLPLGLSKGQNVLNYLTELLAPVDNISDFKKLPIPFYCIGTNIENGKAVVLENGSLPIALRASAAFPSLLTPVEINKELLVDGGVVNNFPADVMKQKEVDLIIGVNVEGQLMKRDELSSVGSLLMQIINFQMYNSSDKQVKLLNVYIRPNIAEYSVIAFDKKENILIEGAKTAKKFRQVFDSIAKLQPIKKQHLKIKLNKKNKFLIDRIVIKGNKNYTRSYILGKLQLQKGDSVSYSDITKKINTLTATKNFNRINYHLKKSFEGKKLELFIKEEKVQSYLNIGLHYDLLYKSAVLLNYNHKKLFIQNDELLFGVAVGDKIRYNLQYFIDNGILPSYGFTSRYNLFNSDFFYDNNLINARYIDFTNAFYFQTTVDKKFAFGIGIEHKHINLSSENVLANGEKAFFDKSNYLDTYSFLKLDTYNKKMFPTKGFYANIGFKWFMWSDRNKNINTLIDDSEPFHQFSQLGGTLGFATTIADKLTLQYTSEAGYTLGSKASKMFDYRLGGNNQNYINNFNSFYGYDTGRLTNQSFLKSEFNFRYQFYNKHYATLIANYARIEEDVFENSNLFDNTKSGYALGYSFETLVGPIELKYSWSPDHSENYWLFNLGFWF